MTVSCVCLLGTNKERTVIGHLTGNHMTLSSDYDCDAGLHSLTGDMFGWYIKLEEHKACVHNFQLSLRKEERVRFNHHHDCRTPKV